MGGQDLLQWVFNTSDKPLISEAYGLRLNKHSWTTILLQPAGNTINHSNNRESYSYNTINYPSLLPCPISILSANSLELNNLLSRIVIDIIIFTLLKLVESNQLQGQT
jgi:hypothetical protein